LKGKNEELVCSNNDLQLNLTSMKNGSNEEVNYNEEITSNKEQFTEQEED